MVKSERRRFSRVRKGEVVMRLIRGESLEDISREAGKPAHELAKWRDQFLDGGFSAFSAPGEVEQDRLERYKAKVGEQSMEIELLREKIRRLEGGVPFHLRRSRK